MLLGNNEKLGDAGLFCVSGTLAAGFYAYIVNNYLIIYNVKMTNCNMEYKP